MRTSRCSTNEHPSYRASSLEDEVTAKPSPDHLRPATDRSRCHRLFETPARHSWWDGECGGQAWVPFDSARVFRASFISSKPCRVLPSSIERINGTSRPLKNSLCTNRVPPSGVGSRSNR